MEQNIITYTISYLMYRKIYIYTYIYSIKEGTNMHQNKTAYEYMDTNVTSPQMHTHTYKYI